MIILYRTIPYGIGPMAKNASSAKSFGGSDPRVGGSRGVGSALDAMLPGVIVPGTKAAISR